MDKAITTGLLIIASVVASVALMNAVLPAIADSSGALSGASASAADRIRTDIEIVHVASPSVGGEDQVLVWVKNIGSQKIDPVESSDIFLTSSTTVKRLSHGSSSGSEYWDYIVEGGGTAWTQTVTLKITLHLADGSVGTGAYTISVAAYNSVSATKDFSV